MLTRVAENSLVVAGIGLVLGNRLLQRAGLRRRADGWRRGTGLVLRGEAATFVLSAFGLNTWSDLQGFASPTIEASRKHFAERLERFLAAEAGCHICVRRGVLEDCAELCDGPSHTLGFEDWVPSPKRFVRPDTWAGVDSRRRSAERAGVLLNAVVRLSPAGLADLWVRVNHVGIDGAAVQEMLSRLEAAWGVAEEVTYPTPQTFANHVGPRPCPGRDGAVEMQAFIDFNPLLAWRKSQNARLPQPMTLSAAVIWRLGQHPAFSSVRVGTTVDVPAVNGLGRGVGVVAIRPSDFRKGKDDLALYVREFNRQLELTRRRESDGLRTLDAAALVPPRPAAALLRYALRGDRAFGSMGLTVLRDAKVFGAPLGDVGHDDGFLALGSVALPTSGGRSVGCVTIKGPANRISGYPALIQEAISGRGDE